MVQVFTAIITPFQADGEINYNLMEDLIDWQTRAGIDGLVVCGTNGEFPSLSFEEVKSLIKFTHDVKQEDLVVVAGTGRTSMKETIALCQYVAELADMVLIVPPFYFKNPDYQGIFDYFKAIFEATTLPIILYNIPQYTGIPITFELVEKLHTYDNFVGIKDSSGKFEFTENLIKNYSNLSIYAGSDALVYRSLEIGAAGCISAISTCLPEEVLEIKISYIAGQKGRAERAQEKLLKIREVFKQYPSRAAIKTALSFLGFPLSYVRPPLVDLNADQIQEFKEKVAPFLSQ